MSQVSWKEHQERGPQEGGTGKVAVANLIVRCGFRKEKEVEGNGGGEGQQLGTHSVKYLWLRKHVTGPWGLAACLSATLRRGTWLPETSVGEEMLLKSVSDSL